ncbi:MAG: metal ABC transporter permease [Desulfovermiculus sp.]
MLDLLHMHFMHNAMLAAALAGIVCAIIGTFVVINRIVFISGGIAHTAYGGVGLAVYCGFAPLLGITLISIAASLVMAWVSLKARHRMDTMIGVLWALGMAVGVILLDLTPGYNVNLMSYLFGSIMTVPTSYLLLMAVLTMIILGTVSYFYHDFVAMSFDPEFARVRGIPVTILYVLLMLMIGLSVVIVIQVVGLILVIALMSISPFIAERFSPSPLRMMGISLGLNLVFAFLGLTLSVTLDVSAGPSIILVASLAFFGVQILVPK